MEDPCLRILPSTTVCSKKLRSSGSTAQRKKPSTLLLRNTSGAENSKKFCRCSEQLNTTKGTTTNASARQKECEYPCRYFDLVSRVTQEAARFEQRRERAGG